MASNEPIINLSGVELTLPSAAGPVFILRGIDLAVSAGDAVSIVGPSGSGKSSLMGVMSGLEQATAGSVRVGELELSGANEDRLARHRRERIGVVLQTFHLIPTMTALENVAVPLELAGRRDAFERAEVELDAVGLAHRLEHYPAQLSGGEQQRTALARAMAPDPDILFADEPTGNLDGVTGAAIIDLMFKLHAERATTLVLVTHDQALARRCARILHMRDGRLDSEETGGASPAELTEATAK